MTVASGGDCVADEGMKRPEAVFCGGVSGVDDVFVLVWRGLEE
jgi:hypothetical protein